MDALAHDIRSEEGIGRMVDAALGGDAEAMHRMAVLAAYGVGIPQNWAAAIEALKRAAEGGHDLAGRQWAVVSTLDVKGLLQPAPVARLSASPAIHSAESFLPASVCDWIVARARPRMEKARTYDARALNGLVSNDRTNTFTDFDVMHSDVVIAIARARIAATMGLDVRGFEDTAVLHYATGEQFRPHYDFLDGSVPEFAADIARLGQRVGTFLVYLSDAYESGETHFPRIGLRHRGPKGGALFFRNVDAALRPDTQTLHEGTAPTSGEKWLLSQFIRVPARATG